MGELTCYMKVSGGQGVGLRISLEARVCVCVTGHQGYDVVACAGEGWGIRHLGSFHD